ncbi:MAG: ComEC/Rec2 family competence protein, partial [Schaalia odontolytica]|nr:ComEC/Rec2 family competence protein [Schaalia odontolytica]
MIDLRLAPAATATWAATWWATGHPAQWAWIGACALVALGCATSYARSQRGRNTPRHALTPSRSARLGLALLLICVACALAVGSAAGRQYDADPALRDSGPVHA